MSKAIKQMQMEVLKKDFENVRDVVMLSVVGLSAKTDNDIRLGLRKKGIRLQMVKNSLARRVLSDLGMTVTQGWEGSSTLAWGGTSIAGLSKELEGILKKNDKFIKVKNAVADGQEVSFDLALKMPTREQAIGIVLGMLLGAGSRLVGALVGPGSQLAGAIKTITEKTEEAAPVATENAQTAPPAEQAVGDQPAGERPA